MVERSTRRHKMVTVRLFFEGGANMVTDNTNAITMDNTARLRESFNTLLNSGVERERVRIEATPAGSITTLVKKREDGALYLMDLDGPKTLKTTRIADNKLEDIQDDLFFMVQRMEAWILSQPDKIEKCFADKKSKPDAIADDNKLQVKHPEDIDKPDEALKVILKRYFTQIKNGKEKKLDYGKLKHAPDLIELLEITPLRTTFEDVDKLLTKVGKMI